MAVQEAKEETANGDIPVVPVVKDFSEKTLKPHEEEDFTPVEPALETIQEESQETIIPNMAVMKLEVLLF